MAQLSSTQARVSEIMEDENEAIIIALLIGAVILGIGLAMFFNRPFAGYGAVVLAIGLMTLSLIITMRAEEIIHLKIYSNPAHSENIAEISVEPPTSTEPATQPSTEMHTQEAEPEEPYEIQYEQTPEVHEVEEAQEVQEVEAEETEEFYEPSWYESDQPQESNFEEPEQDYEPSTETFPPLSEET